MSRNNSFNDLVEQVKNHDEAEIYSNATSRWIMDIVTEDGLGLVSVKYDGSKFTISHYEDKTYGAALDEEFNSVRAVVEEAVYYCNNRPANAEMHDFLKQGDAL